MVILDVMLPDISGWDIYERLKETSYEGEVVFLTIMSASEMDITKLKEDGVSDYITKPFENRDFVKRVNVLLHE